MTFYIYNIECPITEERKSMITKMYVLLQFAIVYFTDLNVRLEKYLYTTKGTTYRVSCTHTKM